MVTLRKNTIAELWGLSPEEKRETAEWLRYEAREQERKAGKANGFDYSKLLKRIKEKYGEQDAFAKAMHMSDQVLSMKLDNHKYFTQKELLKACELLKIADCEIHSYFFTMKGFDGDPQGSSSGIV